MAWARRPRLQGGAARPLPLALDSLARRLALGPQPREGDGQDWPLRTAEHLEQLIASRPDDDPIRLQVMFVTARLRLLP